MIKGLAHLAFHVSDLEKSISFYEDILGFKKKFTLDNEDGTPWLVYLQVNENQFIELFPAEHKIQTQEGTSYMHLCLEVDNIHDLVKNISKKGVKIDNPVIMGLDNNYQAWIHDPDGNPIELMQYGKDALQLSK